MRGGAPLLLALLASCEALGEYASARLLDLGDCVKLSAGGGIGLTVDAKATTYMSPGLGFASYLYVVGWDSRDVHGFWLASDVVNTPRLAYEWFSEEYQETPPEAFDEALFLGRLALTSMALPAERWIRHEDVVTVEYFSLFNCGVTLYVAASDLIPEVNHHGGKSPFVSLSIFAGVAVFFLTRLVLHEFLPH